MNQNFRDNGMDFARFLESLSEEQRVQLNYVARSDAKEEHQDFLAHFSMDSCYICEKPLSSFSKDSPCLHWLLNPKGFKKKYFPQIANCYGFFQVQSFLRWVANYDGFAQNINDLPEEGTGDKIFEVTIKYKKFEWAFSCTESDSEGHGTSQHAQHPHYHFQMRIDRRAFINYSDFHVPFSEMDLIYIEAMRASPQKVKQQYAQGEGMSDILNEETIEHIVKTSVPSEDNDEAHFKLETIAMAIDGETICGDEMYQIIQEAKAKGVTVASLMHKLPKANTQVNVTSGPGVVEQAPRSGRKKNA